MNGIIIVNKEQGFTSHDVVAVMRKILGTKKVGHTGTLDPEATGVLPICVGKGTKVSDMLTCSDKEYIARVTLGKTSDTQDIWGEILTQTDCSHITEEDVKKAAENFIGEIQQTPPMYSAVKIDGKKLYEYARKGIEVERKSRKVTITGIEITDFKDGEFNMKVSCSKGTYIRTLCADLGDALGVGAVMSGLVRTKSAMFTINDAKTLEEIKNTADVKSLIIPTDKVFADLPEIHLNELSTQQLLNGMFLENPSADGQYRVYGNQGAFLCVGKIEEGILKIVKNFYAPPPSTAVVIGKFDGVHKGHQKLLKLALDVCKKDNLEPFAFTFPNGDDAITNDSKKSEILKSFRFNNIYFQPFTEEFKATAPEKYVEYLKTELNAKHVIVGFNFRFGKNRCGDADTMQKLCKANNMGITIAPPVLFKDDTISSTRIRAEIKAGNVKDAYLMMGRPFEITSKVVSGKRLGRKIGFPTINMEVTHISMLPAVGVYATYAELDGTRYPAITNIGDNPTVEVGSPIKAETHIIGFEGDLYGKSITVCFLDKLRDEQDFGDIDALCVQLAIDKEKAIEIFNGTSR